MSNFAGRLIAQLGLDSASFQRGIAAAQTQSKGFAAMMAGASRLVNPFTAALTAAAAAAGAFVIPAVRAAAEIDNVAKAARRVDGSFEGWSAARLAASEAGVGVEALTDQVQNLNARLAQPDNATSAALRRLGLEARNLRLMDVDARLAAVAERVQMLGLDAGQTTRLLRDLGIENRQMAGLIMGGAAALRAARDDIRDYGLSLSEIDTAAIEQANDRMSRLSLISRYMGQQLAVAVVPALGRLAQAFTDSLREGGLLRGMLDGIANRARMVTRAIESVVVIGSSIVQWARDLAGRATDLVNAFVPLNTGIETFSSLLLSPSRGMYGMVTAFADLIRGAGGFGEALGQLGDVARGVWEGIVNSARAIPAGLAVVWNALQRGFVGVVFEMSLAWRRFLASISNSLPEAGAFGGVFDGVRDGIRGAIRESDAFRGSLNMTARELILAGDDLRRTWDDARTGAMEPAREALDRFRETVRRGGAEVDAAAAAQAGLNAALENTPPAAGGAARAVQSMADAAAEATRQNERAADAILGLIPAARQGAQGALRYISDLLMQSALAHARLQMVQAAGSATGGGLLGTIGRFLFPSAPAIPGAATGIRNFQGGLIEVAERGGELIRLPTGSTVIPHDLSARMVGAETQPAPSVTINIDARGAVEGTAAQIDAMLARRLPDIQRAAASYTVDRLNRGLPA